MTDSTYRSDNRYDQPARREVAALGFAFLNMQGNGISEQVWNCLTTIAQVDLVTQFAMTTHYPMPIAFRKHVRPTLANLDCIHFHDFD